MARDELGKKPGRNFASLRATFSRSTVAVNEVPVKENGRKPEREEAKTLPRTKTADRRQSRYTLFDLFSKPKVQTARGYHESGLDVPSEQPAPPKQPIVVDKVQEVAERAEPRPTRKHLPPSLPPILTTSIPESRSLSSEDWGAPPLFQAYPQSIRHGTLQCPSTSMDTLVRAQNIRKQAGFLGNGPALPAVRENGDGEGAQEGSRLVSRRFSILNEAPELVDKVFVLVTAGRLVQYAGEGTFDRMPERVLQLGEKSAAFACDLIPGKHWVVQVVQQVHADMSGQINKSRSILSRLRGPAVGRRSAANVLLVFNSADDMDGWLKAIRSVIEKLGGAKKKEDGEARSLDGDSTASAMDEQISHRYRVSRPTSMISTTASIHRPRSASSFSQPRSPRSPVAPTEVALPPPVLASTHLSPHNTPGNSPKDANFPLEVQSLVGTTTGSPMESSVASSEHSRLERLREGSRASMISTRTSRTSETDNFTVPTSKCSSSPPSPHAETFAEQHVASGSPVKRMSYVAPSPNSRRLSVQPISPAETSIIEIVTPSQRTTQVPYERAQLPEELLGTHLGAASVVSPPTPPNRVSQNFSHPMPIKLRLSDPSNRPTSEFMEPWSTRSRPDSVLGQLPSISTRSLNRLDSVSKRGRPLSRMVPVKPFDPSNAPPTRPVGPGQAVYPRRYSSLPSVGTVPGVTTPRTTTPDMSTPSPGTTADSPCLSILKTTPPRSTPPTHRPRMPSLPLAINSSSSGPSQQGAQQAGALRRPTSMQIRSDPAPFLSQRRTSMTTRPSPPVATVNSYFAGATPSNDFFHKAVPARASSVNFGGSNPAPAKATAPVTPAAIQEMSELSSSPPAITPPIPPMNPNRATVRARSSMPAMMFSGLPPPAPPPSMPLPPPPQIMALPSLPPNIPLPSLPPNVPLPALPPGLPMPSRPPTVPLPPVPTHAMAS